MGRVHKYVEDEIKLEVGKKYDIRDNLISIRCPCEFIAQDKSTAVFRDAKGNLVSIYLIHLVGRITEHREPFKKIFTKWVIFYPKYKPDSNNYELDDLLGIACAPGEVFSLKNEALERHKDLREMGFSNKKVAKVEITITEELPEPEDENS